MIISDKYKYLFLEVPHTASTSISKELRASYAGREITWKHATYTEFLRVANEEQKQYIVFGGSRNPLDIAVTKYLRYKTNKNGVPGTSPDGRKMRDFVTMTQMKAFRCAQQYDFPEYFKRIYRLPFSDGISRDVKKYAQFVIRFEHLEEDFAKLLSILGIEQIRPLPHINKTATKQRDYLSYYTPEIQRQATRVFGPSMEEWGYELPPTWSKGGVKPLDRISYQLAKMLREFYWQKLKLSPHFYGRMARKGKKSVSVNMS